MIGIETDQRTVINMITNIVLSSAIEIFMML